MEQSRKNLSIFSYVDILRSRSPLYKVPIFLVGTLKNSHILALIAPFVGLIMMILLFQLPARLMLELSPEAKEKRNPCLSLSSCAYTERLRQQNPSAKRKILANFRYFRHLPINPHTITPILCHSSTTPTSCFVGCAKYWLILVLMMLQSLQSLRVRVHAREDSDSRIEDIKPD